MTNDYYKCDGCGACCAGNLIIECTALDVLREPRIDEVYPLPKKISLPISESTWVIALGEPCKFLAPDKRCSIYASRPNACVGFSAGSTKCQELRRMHGLPALPPTPAVTVLELIGAQCVDAEWEDA